MSRPKQALDENTVVPDTTAQVISEIIAFLVRCDAEYAVGQTKADPDSPISKCDSSL